MASPHPATVDLSSLDRAALEALIAAQQEKLLNRDNEIEHLKLVIAKLRRMLFGTKSEKISREIDQLELKLEELETQQAERGAASTQASDPTKTRPVRRPLPEHLPREVHTHQPSEDACPDCGGQLRKLGEDVSEILERIPATYKVIRHVRVKMACSRCDVIVQAPAPSRPIERGLPGPNLLAHVLVSKPGFAPGRKMHLIKAHIIQRPSGPCVLWLWEGRTFYSADLMQAVTVLPRSTRCWEQPSSTGWIQSSISAACSSRSPTTPSTASTNSCPGSSPRYRIIPPDLKCPLEIYVDTCDPGRDLRFELDAYNSE